MAVVVPVAAGLPLANLGWSTAEPEPLQCSVVRQPFVHEIPAKGELESAVNVEVRCEVRSQWDSWIRILEVVPEGTWVEPGDFLVRLDSSALETERQGQQIVCARATAELCRARAAFEAAQSARRTYLFGEYALQRQEAELALLVARDRHRTAKAAVESSRVLAEKGYVTAPQLQADQFGLEQAQAELRLATARMEVLQDCTKARRLRELDNALGSSKARLAAAEFNGRLNEEKLAQIEEQIGKCVVRAPRAGQVVLAHLHHEGHSHMIEPGELTREGRVLVRLPDFRQMQVNAKIPEDRIALVRAGLPVSIRLTAFPQVELRGMVTRVSEYAEPQDWHDSIKQYQTIIAIDDPPLDLWPGLTADLEIRVQRLESQLQVPLLAVLQEGPRAYCVTVEEGRWETHEVHTGPNNGQMVVIRSGLAEGQRVMLNPAAHRDKLALSDLPPVAPRETQLAGAGLD